MHRLTLKRTSTNRLATEIECVETSRHLDWQICGQTYHGVQREREREREREK